MPPPKYPDNRFAGPISSQDQISLPDKAVLIFSHPSVPDKLYVHSGANAIKWSYDLNTQTTPTIGGEVTQILSCFVGPMTITGQTAGLRTDIEGRSRTSNPGYNSDASYNANDELKNIIEWFLTYMHSAGQNGKGSRLRDERAILFQYPERGWDFYIQVTALDGFTYDKTVYAPEWSITAEVMDDNALNFFRGITMHSFTDNLVSQKILAGFSEFKGGVADTNNKYFGQDGNSKNPFLNPAISASAAELAKRMGNNFQALVAAWSTSDFANFGFNALLDAGAKPIDIDAAYTRLYGTTYLGDLPGYSGVGSGSGSSTYNVKSGVQAPPWVSAVLKAGGWPSTSENLAWLAGWGRKEGGDVMNTAKYNWLNTTTVMPGSSSAGTTQASVQKYPDFDTGVAAQVKTINNGRYPNVVLALKSGNPYLIGEAMIPDLSVWSGHANDPAGGLAYYEAVMAMNADVVQGAPPSSGDRKGQVEPRQGFDSLDSSLWTAYSIGRRAPYAFTDLGTYVNKPLDHGVGPPANAFDLGISPATGQNNALAKQYFDLMIGRPEIKYVILGDKIWSIQRGLHAYTSGGHDNHIHVSGRVVLD